MTDEVNVERKARDGLFKGGLNSNLLWNSRWWVRVIAIGKLSRIVPLDGEEARALVEHNREPRDFVTWIEELLDVANYTLREAFLSGVIDAKNPRVQRALCSIKRTIEDMENTGGKD